MLEQPNKPSPLRAALQQGHVRLTMPASAAPLALRAAVLQAAQQHAGAVVLTHAERLGAAQAKALRAGVGRPLILAVTAGVALRWQAARAVQLTGSIGLLLQDDDTPLGDVQSLLAQLGGVDWLWCVAVERGSALMAAAAAALPPERLLLVSRGTALTADALQAIGRWPAASLVSAALPTCLRPPTADTTPLGRGAAPAKAPACLGCVRGGCDGPPLAWHGAALDATLRPVRASAAPAHPWAASSEWLGLALGLRRVWRAELPVTELEAIQAAAQASGWTALEGPRVRLDARGAWLDSAEAAEDRGIVYVAPVAADAAAACALETRTLSRGPALPAAESEAQDRAMGALLGYPACCVQAVVEGHRVWKAAHAHRIAEGAFFVQRALAAAAFADRRLDVWSPVRGASPLRHYPCRLDCAASIALAEQLDAAAAAAEPGRAGRDAAARADALVVFANGAALPLRGRREGNGIANPQILSDAERNPTLWWGDLMAAVAPQLHGAERIAPGADHRGVWITLADGKRLPLEWTAANTAAGLPVLIVFVTA